MWLWTVQPEKGWFAPASLHDFEDWRDDNQVFEHLAVFSPGSANLTTDGVAKRVRYAKTSSDFFRVVGVHPALGRAFNAGEDLPGADRIAVLSHGFWQRELGGDPGVLIMYVYP